MAKPRSKEQPFSPVLGEFVPLPALWAEGGAKSIFPSEGSARWFIYSNRAALVEAKAIAIHAGRTLVHLARFEDVAQAVALRAAAGARESA